MRRWLLFIWFVTIGLCVKLFGTEQDIRTTVAFEISQKPDTQEDSQRKSSLFTNPREIASDVFYAVASFYGRRFHNAFTANKERYKREGYTCAHRTLPFNTLLRVTNESNGKTVVVRVNDRGPFGKGRDIDLSYAAAKDLGILNLGIKRLRIEVIGN